MTRIFIISSSDQFVTLTIDWLVSCFKRGSLPLHICSPHVDAIQLYLIHQPLPEKGHQFYQGHSNWSVNIIRNWMSTCILQVYHTTRRPKAQRRALPGECIGHFSVFELVTRLEIIDLTNCSNSQHIHKQILQIPVHIIYTKHRLDKHLSSHRLRLCSRSDWRSSTELDGNRISKQL